jgi:hypothetical protein
LRIETTGGGESGFMFTTRHCEERSDEAIQ